jgi:ubiquinone/menaquinone biosynthesis C-methylase UbiE
VNLAPPGTLLARGDAVRLPLPDRCVDLVFGSGTTCAVAAKHDRRGIGLDLRMSQCELGRRRIAEGLRPVSKLDGAKALAPLAGQRSLFE